MFLSILAALALIGAVVAFVLAARGIAAGLAFLFVVLIVVNTSTTIIEAKNVGVQTRFGKPVGSLGAGFHFKAPWDKVTELDGTKITNRYDGDSRIPVRIGDGTTAHVTAAIRWSIVPDKADEIYADYRSDDVNANLRESLVETVFTNAMNQVFGGFNPTSSVKVVSSKKADTAADTAFVPNYDALAAEVTESMKERVEESGGYVRIDFVTISNIDLSEQTQTKINALQSEIAKTQVARQELQTASAQADANRELQQSLSAEIIANNCFEIIKQMVDEKQPVPVGGIGCTGGNDNLILPGAAKQ